LNRGRPQWPGKAAQDQNDRGLARVLNAFQCTPGILQAAKRILQARCSSQTREKRLLDNEAPGSVSGSRDDSGANAI